ncbi:hypothetical protein HF668_11630 [Acidithiobacillus ferridurans]|uniref:hypothetical protein n=1 Tax=Acidithiobacillus ferridurans TaxID=1232575 RepID=UPI001C07ABE4|nr:hypothetical protein [Acidithiobacillus ferridurans]MBU2805781.1 hypothetical protein [Acidithiobacillus ferridurans]
MIEKKTAREMLGIVQWRLTETLSAFAVLRMVNERANESVNADLHAKINARRGFWRTVQVALHTTVVIGIFALVDRKTDSATLQSVLERLGNKVPCVLRPRIKENRFLAVLNG